jgi:hypothetical protein
MTRGTLALLPRLRCTLAFVLSLLAIAAVGPARAAADPPPGMSRDQFDALVSAVAETLSKGLSKTDAGKADAGKADGKAATATQGPDEIDEVAQTVETLARRAPGIVRAVPSLPAQTVAMVDRFDRSGDGGRSAAGFLELLIGCILALIALDVVLGLVLRPLLGRIFATGTTAVGLVPAMLGGGVEILRFLLVWIASRVCLGALFAGAGVQTPFATVVLDSAVAVFAIRALLEIWLRPGWPAARLVPVDDLQAARLKTGITAVAILVRIGQVWTAMLSGETLVSAALLVNAIVVPLAYAWLAWTCRDVFGTWLGTLFGSGDARSIQKGTRFWLGAIAIVIALVLLLRLYAALADRPDVPLGTMVTVTTFILLLFGETVIRWMLNHPEAAAARSDVEARLLRSGARLARIAMLLAAAGVVARTWLVDALQLVPVD